MWSAFQRLRSGFERACFHRFPLGAAHVVRQETTGTATDAAIRWLGPVNIGGVSHDGLLCHPTSSVEFRVSGWEGGRVVAWCGLLPDVWAKNTGGVEFHLTARGLDGGGQRTRSRRLAPGSRPIDRRWCRLTLPLPADEGGWLLTLSTAVPSRRSAAHASALWGDPQLVRRRPASQLWSSVRHALRLLGIVGTFRRLRQLGESSDAGASYRQWVARHTPTPGDLQRMAQDADRLAFRPRISIVTPVYNTDPRWLQWCIDSVRRQVYPDWELCLCDDGSTSEATLEVLRQASDDPRVRVVSLASNQGISAASNAALAAATGDFVAMLDHDDELTADALFQVVKHLNEHPDADMIYSDEDKLDPGGQRCDPYFKPDWSPEHFLCCMYTCHLMVVRRGLLLAVGGFRVGYEGSQDYDLVLRIVQRTARIHHIPRVLYHWRKVEGSAAGSGLAKPWAVEAARRAIADHMRHEGIDAGVEIGAGPGQFRVRPRLRDRPLVSIVLAGGREPIGAADAATALRCLRSFERDEYGRYEVVVVHDGSLPSVVLEAVEQTGGRAVAVGDGRAADRVNSGVEHARGAHLVICCELVEARNPGWLLAMLEYSQQPAIGAVGARLSYPDGRIRHVGVVLGLGGIAGLPFHGFPGSSAGYISSAVGIRNYSAVSGSCLMTRREVFTAVGGFRPAFGALSDMDYSLRLRRAGYRIVFTPYAEGIYHGIAASPVLVADAEASAEMRCAWETVIQRDPCYNPNLTTQYFDYRPRLDDEGR